LEASIIETGIDLRAEGRPVFHGFTIATRLRDEGEGRLLTARGTLYKALDRLERRGYLASEWEDPQIAMSEGRPRRRLYRVTAEGERALAEREASAKLAKLIPGRVEP
jgi:DNA-binding PadR family transcriptional regulator